MFRFLCLLVLLFSSLISTARADGPVTLILAHGAKQNPFTVPAAALAWKFKESVEQASERQILVQIVPDGQAGQDAALVPLVKKGVIHSALLPATALLAEFPPPICRAGPL